MSGRDHYQVLGVQRGADQPEIRRAYLALARKHHPDRHQADPMADQARHRSAMQEVNAAWAVLGDVEARKRYDADLVRGTAAGGGGPGTAGRSGSVPPPKGPGWRPRHDDTGWMDDFGAWRDETDHLLPPEDAPAGPTRPLAVVPPGLFFLGVGLGCVGVVLQHRPLMAAAWLCVLLSAVLFFLFPLFRMGRVGSNGRRDRG